MNSDTDTLAVAEIADYLDYLCAPLLGIVPYMRRSRLRAEAEEHLYALVEDFRAEGFAPKDAVRAALREYGEPWRIGQSFADVWLSRGMPSRLIRYTDAATLRAFGWFGLFTVLNLLVIEWNAFEPSHADLSPLISCLAVVSPLMAGVLTGIGLDSRTSLGICRVMALLGLASAAVGLVMRPQPEGLTFAGFQVVFWLPVGCLSATLAASLRRQLRLQRFRHITRPSHF